MKIKTDTPAPEWLVRMAQNQLQQGEILASNVVRVTSLLQPAHQVRLIDQHRDELEIDPIDQIPALLGTAWHALAEDCDPDRGMTEERINRQVGNWILSGQIDYFDDELVMDRKTAKCWSRVFGKPEWAQQLNLYAWLVDPADELGRRLEVHVVYVDWTENQAKRNQDFPQSRFEIIPIRRWSQSEVEGFIDERLALLDQQSPPICSPEERWERGEVWAVAKPGRKSAVSLHGSQDAAEFAALEVPRGTVEHRPGDPVRCRSWCPVRQWCEFGSQL